MVARQLQLWVKSLSAEGAFWVVALDVIETVQAPVVA
jgi:hypothetical protein